MKTLVPTLERGALAYLDAFCALVPCKVLEVWRLRGLTEARVKLTATRGAYKRGEILVDNAIHVVPRRCIATRSGRFAILPYHIKLDSEGAL